ncbi:conserved membrane hypothetical protein [Tenacibaculum sp. 190524A05c]
MNTRVKMKNLQLLISAIVVIAVSFVYGFNPSEILPAVFGFEVTAIDLKNIFRAIMGLYIFFGVFWIVGIVKSRFWEAATLSNILFMGGLASGRIISTFADGISKQFLIGAFLELIMMFWGINNLKKYKSKIR